MSVADEFSGRGSAAAPESGRPDPPREPEAAGGSGAPDGSGESHAVLDGRYAFESFVVGAGNRLAYAAAKSVTEDPGRGYGPLFLHAPGGLGKTHLLGAIGCGLLRERPAIRVRYARAASLIGELAGVRSGSLETLPERAEPHETGLLELDVLLVDDLQESASHPEARAALLGALDALRQAGKQVVLASDREPEAIASGDGGALAWLRRGLVVDIQSPDRETRAAILRTKARGLGEELSPEVVDELAGHAFASVRELEVALYRLAAMRAARAEPLTVAGVRELLGPPGGPRAVAAGLEGWDREHGDAGARGERLEDAGRTAASGDGTGRPAAPGEEPPAPPREDLPPANVDAFFTDPYKVFLHWEPLADRLLERLE